jgi:O-glycosyl hydrolase
VTFGHLTINNEPDITGHWEGATCGAAQSKVLTERVVDALNAMGLSNLEIVGPTTSTNNISYRDELRSSSKAMSKLKHFDSHHYGSSLGSNAYTEIKISLYPNMTYWVSEENIWCGGCDGGGRIPNTMSVGLDATGHVLSDLGNGVSGFYLWDGLDSYYDYAPVYTGFSGWGLMDYNTGTKQYTKRNYLLGCRSIICKFVLDGMRRINATAGYAFYDSATNRFSIVDRNTGGSYSLTGTLENLPTVSMLQFWYQDATHNVCRASDVSVANQQFTVTIPASSVWALHGAGTPTSLAPRSLRRPDRPDCLIRVVDIRGRILVAVNTDAFPAGVYAMYVGADHDRSQRFLHIASGNKQATFVNIP